jgi:hypothetical protein
MTAAASTEESLVLSRLARINSDQHLLETLVTLAERTRRRWTEAESLAGTGSVDFKHGLATGYVQAIGLLLDVPYTTARTLVLDGHL